MLCYATPWAGAPLAHLTEPTRYQQVKIVSYLNLNLDRVDNTGVRSVGPDLPLATATQPPNTTRTRAARVRHGVAAQITMGPRCGGE